MISFCNESTGRELVLCSANCHAHNDSFQLIKRAGSLIKDFFQLGLPKSRQLTECVYDGHIVGASAETIE